MLLKLGLPTTFDAVLLNSRAGLSLKYYCLTDAVLIICIFDLFYVVMFLVVSSVSHASLFVSDVDMFLK